MPYEVAYYDCDMTGAMKIQSLLAVVIRASEEQSDSLDRGSAFVAEFGLTWVITQYEIEITRLPKVGEMIQITTEAISYNKFFCYRNFLVTDGAGEQLVLIKTTFALMDIANRKMSSVLPEVIDPYESEKIKKIIRWEKIEPVIDGDFLPYRVRFYDLDSNQHVNNAVYFNWLLDVLGHTFLTTHELTEIHVKFNKEVEYGHEIESHFEIEAAADQFVTRHEIRIGELVYCEANMTWQSAGH